jgi:ribonuclease G
VAKNLLVVSVDIRETRVALIEDGIIAELHIERRNKPSQGSVGDVVLGKVTRVLPGLQAAFIDVAQERAAFLHVEDLIRPDDFDTYLAGGRKHARDEEAEAPEATGDEELDAAADAELPATVALEAVETHPPEPDAPIVDEPQPSQRDFADAEPSVPGHEDDSPGDEQGDEEDQSDAEAASRASQGEVEDSGWEPDPSHDRPTAPTPIPPPVDLESAAESETAPKPEAYAGRRETPDVKDVVRGVIRDAARDTIRDTPRDTMDMPDLPGFTVSDPGEPVPMAPARPSAALQDRRREGDGRGGGRRRGRDRGRGRGPGRGGQGGGGDRGRGRSNSVPGRISKTTPIRDVVREGQEIIVQISKDPIGTKGARCTSHISLPGRYVVYLPTVDHVGVSKRIGSEKERARLRETIESMKPPSGGLIVRTVAEGLTKKQLKQDVGYLVRLWGEIAKKREGARAPVLLSGELDLVLKTARDLFTDEVEQIVIDDKTQYERLRHFVEMFMPERIKDIAYYSDDEPIFDAYGIEDEIGRALSRKVPLPSGGCLVIDQAEALTAIDVNTGRFVGKGSKDMEETILKTNLEAVHEIAYQLRFRNIGGLIILDLIDMERHQNREKVRRELEELLQKDKAKTTLNRISDLGLIEMTRKRTRESLGRLLHEPCFYCDGTGQLQSKETVAYEILREIRRRRSDLPGYTIVVHAHPAVADLLQGPERASVADAENRFMRKILVVPRTEYHLEQFDLSGK